MCVLVGQVSQCNNPHIFNTLVKNGQQHEEFNMILQPSFG